MGKIDARGMSCPQPVIMAKNAIKKNPDQVEILVDNETAKGNVERFLSHEGYSVTFLAQDEDMLVKGTK